MSGLPAIASRRVSYRFVDALTRVSNSSLFVTSSAGPASVSMLSSSRLEGFPCESADVDLAQCPEPVRVVFPHGSSFPGDYAFGLQALAIDPVESGLSDRMGNPVISIVAFLGIFTPPERTPPGVAFRVIPRLTATMLAPTIVDMAEQVPGASFRLLPVRMPVWMAVERFRPERSLWTWYDGEYGFEIGL